MRRLVAAIVIVIVWPAAVNASGFSIYEASIRANGMLGAFAAYAEHVSTIYYNPAGLSNLRGVQISGGVTYISPNSSFRGPLPVATNKFDVKDNQLIVPNMFTSYQLMDGLTVGLGVYTPFGHKTEWDSDWVGRGASIDFELQTVFVNPAMGFTIPDFGIGKIQIGFGLMISTYGELKFSRALQIVNPEGRFDLNSEMMHPGIGFNGGILYQPAKFITFGFTYRSEINMEFDGKAVFDNDSDEFSGTGMTKTSMDLPASWAAGVKIEPILGLKAEIDYVWWGWSSYDKWVITFDEVIELIGSNEIIYTQNFEDSYQIRGGVEYTGLPVKGLVIRAGAAYDKNPVQEEFISPSIPDSDRILFSGGITYSINRNIEIDASYIYARSEERVVTNSNTGVDGIYNSTANLPGFGVTLKF